MFMNLSKCHTLIYYYCKVGSVLLLSVNTLTYILSRICLLLWLFWFGYCQGSAICYSFLDAYANIFYQMVREVVEEISAII